LQAFNNKADWPDDGSQPFVWSSGDASGFSNHADYMFGWKDDSLQRAMDAHTYVSTPTLKTQSIANQNKCTVQDMVGEDIDSCKCMTYLNNNLYANSMYRATEAAGRYHGSVDPYCGKVY
jgi:hypothetical protein